MMSLTFGLFTQVNGSGPLGPLVFSKSYDGFGFIFGMVIDIGPIYPAMAYRSHRVKN